MAATSTCLTPAGGSAWSQNSAVQRRESGGVGSEWADAKAREWWDKVNPPDTDPVDDLAALLREVGGQYVTHIRFDDHGAIRAAALAEVRKIVEDEAAAWACNCDEAWKGRSLIDPDCGKCNYISEVCDEILRRIEGLK